MRALILTYALVALCALALLSVLSYGYGAGYIYVYWRNWQLQSNVWVAVFLIGIVTFLVQILWITVRRYVQRRQRKIETYTTFSQLHPYEQLGVIWLLDASKEQQAIISRMFAQSGLLEEIAKAKLYFENQEYEQAFNVLNQSSPNAFELAELQRIELFLATDEADQALTHLEFLQQQQLSPWLKQIESAYKLRIITLWEQLALQQPWLYLKSQTYGNLPPKARNIWLQELLEKFDQASPEDLYALQQRYLKFAEEINTRPFDSKVLWLKLLARLPEMSQQHELFALALLNEQFDRDVFYMWFQQQLLKQHPNYQDIENKISQLEQRYFSIPILTFAKWHIYMATAREEDAKALLRLYPNDILMNYLRIKSELNEQQVQQLNSIFESNSNFLQFRL